jgi:hypothetical protein
MDPLDPDNADPSALVQATITILLALAFFAVLCGYCA